MSAEVQGTAPISDGSVVGFSIRLSGYGVAGTRFDLPSSGAYSSILIKWPVNGRIDARI